MYGFMIMFYITVYPTLNSGPMWFNYDIITKDCEDYWWTNLLFLNNFIPDGIGNSCVGVGWYLADDMQFFWTAPLIILFYYYSAK